MQTKIVYAFDPETKFYTGPVQLDESDQCQIEPGVWHIPGNCLDVEPPEYRAGEYLVAVGDHWETRVVRESEPVDEPAAGMPEAPEPTREMRAAYMEVELQAQLDATARAHGYRSIDSAVSYADEMSVAKYCGEGRGFRRLRSQAWAKFYELTAGDGDLPTMEVILPQLPPLDVAYVASETAVIQASIDAQVAAALAPAVAAEPVAEVVASDAADAGAAPVAPKRTKRAKA